MRRTSNVKPTSPILDLFDQSSSVSTLKSVQILFGDEEIRQPNIRETDKKSSVDAIWFVHPMRDATLMHSIFAVDGGDNHDKGNDNGSPTDTKMTGQKDLTRIILTNG